MFRKVWISVQIASCLRKGECSWKLDFCYGLMLYTLSALLNSKPTISILESISLNRCSSTKNKLK